MGSNTIRCINHAEIHRYYWYMGSTLETDPILKLVNGEMDGSKYNDGHYDITPLVRDIKNAQLEHEATYTFVAFFTNDSDFTRDISVIITACYVVKQTLAHLTMLLVLGMLDKGSVANDLNQHSFVLKSSCADVKNVSLLPENESANLTCFIEGVRPQPAMYWTYEGVACFKERVAF
ncbi:hypothetical protein BSL78_15799 [Apostichopus japonicus]|uniref:Ig-like domain-containing protein n=1 Tax=Stichopus japonicus TaxID=307972 RepID=A0A2G8KH99_STIJA|nr:hypothetical protein BSL78_15799 [Apostichopus japonicus]